MGETFVHARIHGAGLGNNLMTWARAEVYASRFGLRVIAPKWRFIKIGPILRRERDWRQYGGFFNHGEDIRGPRAWWLLRTASRSKGPAGFDEIAPPIATGRGPHIVEFDYYSGHAPGQSFKQIGQILAPLIPHADFLHKRLRQITRPEHLRVADSLFNEPFIGIHCRRGDKPPLASGVPYPPDTDHPTLPIEWYVKTLNNVRRKLGFDAPVVLFSDGRPHQLEPLMSLPNVKLAPIRNALIDMLLLTKARIMISTLSSSFSRWAAMLGKMPNIHYPGRSFHLVEDRRELTMFTDLDGELPDSTIGVLRTAMFTPCQRDEHWHLDPALWSNMPALSFRSAANWPVASVALSLLS